MPNRDSQGQKIQGKELGGSSGEREFYIKDNYVFDTQNDTRLGKVVDSHNVGSGIGGSSQTKDHDSKLDTPTGSMR